MIENTVKYRIITDAKTRRLIIQTAGTWAEVASIQFPDDPGLIAAVKKGIEELLQSEGPSKAETPAAPKKTAGGKKTK